ncbi:helix-turn-helix domain-containing protein [Coleofasciculus sp. C1-SOL-03]|uniref:helix-turn-helix domain-containing protein n=1 Tax=Coleofasciculus sp. C1-SOL-03 TaxID=3069522 RepID=UPI0040641659
MTLREGCAYVPQPNLLAIPYFHPFHLLLKPMTPRPLTQRERDLIEFYTYCELGMTPKQFYAKWQVTYEIIAALCFRSLSTVNAWFSRGRYYRRPTPNDLRNLALMDFILEHFEEIPEDLLDLLCPSSGNNQ